MATIGALPPELLQLVFSKLGGNLSEQAVELSKVGRVCRTWLVYSSSDEMWRPLLRELSPRQWKKLSDQAQAKNLSVKAVFANTIIGVSQKLIGALELLDAPKSSFTSNNALRLVAYDATALIVELMGRSHFSLALILLLQNNLINHEKIFEKLITTNLFTLKENLIFYLLMLKYFLGLGLSFRDVYDRLNDEQLYRLQEVMLFACVYQNVSILQFVTSGLNPNTLMPLSLPSAETYLRMPLALLFINSCLQDPMASQLYYNKLFTSEKQPIPQRTKGEIEALWPEAAFCPQPITQEELFADFHCFLKIDGFDINAKSFDGNTILFSLQNIETFKKSNQSLKERIEQLLIGNGAI